jgi:uncharacterized membrane protein YphA (DoxX/SURF4 family)
MPSPRARVLLGTAGCIASALLLVVTVVVLLVVHRPQDGPDADLDLGVTGLMFSPAGIGVSLLLLRSGRPGSRYEPGDGPVGPSDG